MNKANFFENRRENRRDICFVERGCESNALQCSDDFINNKSDDSRVLIHERVEGRRSKPGARRILSMFATDLDHSRCLPIKSRVSGARRAVVTLTLSIAMACFATTGIAQIESLTTAEELAARGQLQPPRNPDPFEPFNRSVYAFNNGLDTLALRPLAVAYDKVVSAPGKKGVNNFFGNLYDVTSAFNSALQWRWGKAFSNTGRVLINSTLGLAGLLDVATALGIERHPTDFGQTLARWGVPEGPYLMLPLFGPSTVRSGAGTLVDTFAFSVTPYIEEGHVRYTMWGTEFVHLRSTLLETDQLITGDRYIFLRDAYLASRSAFVNDGAVVDDFSDFEDSWDVEFE